MRYYAASLALGACFGIALLAPAIESARSVEHDEAVAASVFDGAYPVLHAEYRVLEKSPSQLRVTLVSLKLRQCQLLEVQAFDVEMSRGMRRLKFERADGAAPTPIAVGASRSSEYVVSPAPVGRLSMWFVHSCDGKTVRTQIQESKA